MFKTYKIFFKDKVVLGNGKILEKKIPCGTLAEAENGFTIEIPRFMPDCTFFVEQPKKGEN